MSLSVCTGSAGGLCIEVSDSFLPELLFNNINRASTFVVKGFDNRAGLRLALMQNKNYPTFLFTRLFFKCTNTRMMLPELWDDGIHTL